MFNETEFESKKPAAVTKPEEKPEEKQYVSIKYFSDGDHDGESEVEPLLRQTTTVKKEEYKMVYLMA